MYRKDLIGPKIKALSNAMDQEMNRCTAALGLTGSQAFILGYLVHHGDRPIYQKDIEREFEFSHPTVSGILRRLEGKGFVTFREGRTDRRCKQILVTQLAQERHQAVVVRMMEVEARCTAGMPPEDVAALHRLLLQAMQNMGVAFRCEKKKEREESE